MTAENSYPYDVQATSLSLEQLQADFPGDAGDASTAQHKNKWG